jgi:hypothetical protein
MLEDQKIDGGANFISWNEPYRTRLCLEDTYNFRVFHTTKSFLCSISSPLWRLQRPRVSSQQEQLPPPNLTSASSNHDHSSLFCLFSFLEYKSLVLTESCNVCTISATSFSYRFYMQYSYTAFHPPFYH